MTDAARDCLLRERRLRWWDSVSEIERRGLVGSRSGRASDAPRQKRWMRRIQGRSQDDDGRRAAGGVEATRVGIVSAESCPGGYEDGAAGANARDSQLSPRWVTPTARAGLDAVAGDERVSNGPRGSTRGAPLRELRDERVTIEYRSSAPDVPRQTQSPCCHSSAQWLFACLDS